jgi:hypothetical protein
MGDKEIHSGSWKRGGRGFWPCIVGMAFPRDPPIVRLDFRATDVLRRPLSSSYL